jgi:replicative DNA helicase
VAPPQNLDAERRVLGSLIVFYTPEALQHVQGAGLKPSDFYYRAHEVVYRAIAAISTAGEWVDALTVRRFLETRSHPTYGTWLVAAGGPARVEELACHADANGLLECARMVAEDGRWRRWLFAMYEGIEAAHARDEAAFWAAIGHVREDVLPGELRVVAGEGKAA